MLELYHWEPNLGSLQVLICLKEKGLDFTSRYLDLLAFEHLEPQLLKINPLGQVPILVHNGVALTEANFICEYIDEVFPSPALMPPDPKGKWQARVWEKMVDEDLAPFVPVLGWRACRSDLLEGRDVSGMKAAAERAPLPERRQGWQDALSGYSDAQAAEARRRVGNVLARTEQRLADGDWLAGSSYSLADIAVFAMLHGLPEVCPDLVGAEQARTTAWLRRVETRPAVAAALAAGRSANPRRRFAPGPEQVRWG